MGLRFSGDPAFPFPLFSFEQTKNPKFWKYIILSAHTIYLFLDAARSISVFKILAAK